ncbi:MAG: sialate O-acetylesterase, partial [Tannerellaceae bacterium]|nr:sialate O-acetylesterase [Tannerellaceae bacterium]
ADGAGTGIKIRTRHNSSSVEKTFTVMTGVDIAIEANRLYRLTVSQNKQAFNITVADWTDADDEFATVIQPAPQIDIYLCMGQSNMVGYTNYVADYTPVSSAYVYNSTANSWVAPSNPISAYNVLGDVQNGKIGPHYGFLLDMVNYYPGRKIAIVLAGYGGREIATFLPGNGSGYYSGAVAAAKAAVVMSGGTIRAVLWHQGEWDSDNADRIAQYEGKLQTLISSLRTDLGIPNLPFIAGEITEDPAYSDTYSRGVAFNVELNRIAASSVIQYFYVIQSDGLTLQDGWHFNSSSMVTLGQRYATRVHSILSE